MTGFTVHALPVCLWNVSHVSICIVYVMSWNWNLIANPAWTRHFKSGSPNNHRTPALQFHRALGQSPLPVYVCSTFAQGTRSLCASFSASLSLPLHPTARFSSTFSKALLIKITCGLKVSHDKANQIWHATLSGIFGPQATYTDRATAACWQIHLCNTVQMKYMIHHSKYLTCQSLFH